MHGGGLEKQVGLLGGRGENGALRGGPGRPDLRQVGAGQPDRLCCDSEGGSSGSPIVAAGTNHVNRSASLWRRQQQSCLNSGTELSSICADAGFALELRQQLNNRPRLRSRMVILFRQRLEHCVVLSD